jgi:hypothetical protein
MTGGTSIRLKIIATLGQFPILGNLIEEGHRIWAALLIVAMCGMLALIYVQYRREAA